MTTLQFFVPGIPAPQGSKKHVGNGVMIEASAKTLKPWRQDIVHIARSTMVANSWVTVGAAEVSMSFYFIRPKSVSAKKRPHHTVKPDGDKLARAVFDSLTIARVFQDDANVVDFHVHKAYSIDGFPPGVRVIVSAL